MGQISLLTPAVYKGVISDTPSGNAYSVVPGQIVAADASDFLYLLSLGFSSAPPQIVGSVFLGSISAKGVTANSKIDGSVPPNSYLIRAFLRETAGHQVVITFGTTLSGSDVAPSDSLTLTVPANGTLTIDTPAFAANWFSSVASQNIFINSASWSSASINVQLDYEVGP